MKKYASESLFVLFCVWLLTSCTGVKTSSGPGSPGLVKIFSKGQDSLLCHAGPVKFKADGHSDDLSMDYTYLKVRNTSNPVTCNFSIITRDESFRPQHVVIEVNGLQHTFSSLQKFFAEGYGKKDYIHRYSFQISDSLFYDWMKAENSAVFINDKKFISGKKFRKDASEIYRKILFDLR